MASVGSIAGGPTATDFSVASLLWLMLYNQAPQTGERCRSGRTGLPAKQLHGLKPVPRVRIPPSPPVLPSLYQSLSS